MISEELNFNPSNTLQVFAYEGFQYTISNVSGFTLQNVSGIGSGLRPESLFFTKNANISYIFGVPDTSNNLTPGTTEQFTLTTISGSTTLTSSNTVNIGGGRFLDASGESLSNNVYSFFQNEEITPIRLVAPSFTLRTPTSIPALPPGLSFVRDSSSIFDIRGTPRVPVPTSNYQIIGIQQGGSKIVTTRFNMGIGNERLQLDLSGASIVGGMQINASIDPRVLTAFPPQGTTTLRYTYPSLPDGIVVTDLAGTVQSSPFVPTDPSYTLIVQGTPTLAAANAFKNGGITTSGSNIPIRVTRLTPTLLENSQAFTFSFGETVLFETPTLSNNYVGIPVNSNLNFFEAGTYFTSSNVSITNIFATSLPDGLSLEFLPGLPRSRARLFGTPTTSGSASYTIRAINFNGFSNDLQQTLTISNDSVSFSSPVGDICLNFILSRNISNFKPGFYSSNIQFEATAASKLPVTLSTPALDGTGLSLSNGFLIGTPTTVTPLTDLIVTAIVSGSPATATKTIKFAILDDEFTFTDVSAINLIQNVQAIPFRFPVSTLSDRNVINYSQIGFPDGIIISPAGVVSGTPTTSIPTAGNVTIRATTGFSTGERDFSYNIIPDSMIFVVPQTRYLYGAGDPVGTIDIDGITFSGRSVSNYDLSISPTYGLSIESLSGSLLGTWTLGIPPQTLLPSSCNFTVTAQAGGLVGTLPMSFTANPIVAPFMLFSAYGIPSVDSSYTSWIYATEARDISGFIQYLSNDTSGTAFVDIKVKNNDQETNVILAVDIAVGNDPSTVYKASWLDGFEKVFLEPSPVFSPKMTTIVYSGESTWFLAGTCLPGIGLSPVPTILRSDDDGSTWDIPGRKIIEGVVSRDNNGAFTAIPDENVPYINAGVAFAMKNGVMLAGGIYVVDNPVMVYSTDSGNNWETATNEFAAECAYINTDDPIVSIATGSSLYRSIDALQGSVDVSSDGSAMTIKYSSDNGRTWFDVDGGFNVFGYEIAYGNGTWLATGVSARQADVSGGPYYFAPELRYSTNAVDWIQTDLTNSLFSETNEVLSNVIAPLRVGSMTFDGTFWNVFVNEETPENGRVQLYRHDVVSDLLTGWFAVDISGSTGSEPVLDSNTRFLSFHPPRNLYTGEPPIDTIVLDINTNLVNGPTFTSPATTSYVLYQYARIAPIQLSATGSGQIYFFVETADIPPGISYNRLTNQLTGSSVQIGKDSITFYAQDDNGITKLVLNFTTVVPRVIRKQDGAGAYTSLLRQYTEVLGAQNSRDNRVLPTQERALGEFMSPEAPDVDTPYFNTKTCATCKRPECPTVNERVDSGNARTAVCNFIDGNEGTIIDAGNAEPDICDPPPLLQ